MTTSAVFFTGLGIGAVFGGVVIFFAVMLAAELGRKTGKY